MNSPVKQNKTGLFQQIAEFPFFLLLTGAYPVLFLLAANRDQTSLASAGYTLVLGVAVAVFIGAISILLVRPRSKAYLAATAASAAFFAYGHIFNLFDGQTVLGVVLRHRYILPIFLAIAGGLLLWIILRPAPRRSPAPLLNAIFLALCLFQVVPILSYQLSARAAPGEGKSTTEYAVQAAAAGSTEAGPDIYYIILDGMPRADVLREVYGYSDYQLEDALKERGFIIPQCAYSNYGGTSTSMTSAFQMDYLDRLGVPDEEVNNDINDPPILYNLLHNNPVVEQLKSQGYLFAAFRGFFPLNDFQEADLYYNFFENQEGSDTLSERNFRGMFVNTTLMRIPSERYEANPEAYPYVPQIAAELFAPRAGVFRSRSYEWYQQHLYSFEKLESLPEMPEKTFIYAHFYTTHQPYVFHPDGSLLWPIQEDNNGFLSAARYTSQRILEAIDHILAESETPPVIILQADHGTGAGLDKYKILNAYYLPGVDPDKIYPTITPVNSFRLLFNEYTGSSYAMLPDVIMYGEAKTPEPFERIPAQCGLE